VGVYVYECIHVYGYTPVAPLGLILCVVNGCYRPVAPLVLNVVRHNLTDCATEDEEVGGRFARSNLRDCATEDEEVGGRFARSNLRDCATEDEEVGGRFARSNLRRIGGDGFE